MATWAIYKRELKTYFQSPSTYIVIALIFLLMGMIFQNIMAEFSDLSMRSQQMGMWGQQQQAPNVTHMVIRGVFYVMFSLILFSIPLLSMRLLAEEKSRGTLEMIVTCPVGDWSLIMGKYLALVSVGVFMIILSSLFPLMVWYVGKPGSVPEWPIVGSLWIGLLLIFAAYSAFGLMASSMTENQMAAGVVTLIGLLLWNMMGDFQIEQFPQVNTILKEMSASQHTENFLTGVLALKDFVFYILSSFLFLFIASKTLDARRWRV
ncbi:ABC transporter permease [bacterium]|nr:ABC transporter permease [bacterium]